MSNRPSYRKEFEAKLRANRERAALRRAVLAFFISLISCLVVFWAMGMAFGAELSPSTCKVVEFSPMGSVEAHGSGVLVAKADGAGYVLTAKHVAEKKPGNRMMVLFPRSFEFAFLSSAVTHAPDDIDLSLLMIDAPADIAPRPIAWRLPETGEKVWQSGFGNSKRGPREWWSNVLPLETSQGRWTSPSLLLLNRPSTQGDSGGPIIDAHGRVVGICTNTDDTRGYHVTVADQQWLREIIPAQERSIVVKK